MARLGVTYQDIANAAEQILGQGRQPTIELIRNLLGTGSTTTIANHLRKWRAEQDGSTSVAIKENLPQEFVAMMKGLWQRLQAHADNLIITVKQEAEQTTQHLRQDIEKYKTNNQRWQKLHDTWVKEKSELARSKLGLEEVILSLQKDNADNISKLSVQQHQIDEKQQRISELHRLHKLAQENLEHYRESMRMQRLIEQEKHEQLELNLKNAEQHLLNFQKDKILLQTQLDQVISENKQQQKTFADINQQHHTLQSEFGLLQKEQNETKHDLAHFQQQYDNLLKKFDAQAILLIEQQKQNALLSQQLSIAREEVNELKEQNKFLAREKWEIAQEKAQIEGANRQLQKMMQAKELS